MTGVQPDAYWPTDASNYDSFAGFANTTQAEWETQLVGGFNTAFGPWSGVCALLEQVPFVGDLIEMGGGPESGLFGLIGALLEGLTVAAENICALLLGTEPPGDTTPTTMLDGFTSVFDGLLNSPFVQGLILLAEDTGNLLTDIINALLGFFNTLCSVFTGTYDPNATTPQTIVEGVQGVFDKITGSGFLSAFIRFAETTGNLVVKFLDGVVRFLDQAWNLLVALFPSLFGKSPDDVLAETISDNVTKIINDMLSAAMDWLNSLPELLSSLINAILQMIAAIPELIMAVITGVLNWLAFLPEAITAVVNGILALITELPDIITEAINTIVGWFTDDHGLFAQLIDTIMSLVDQIPEIISQIINSIVTWIGSLPELIGNVVNAFLGWLDAIPELASALLSAIVGWITALPELAGAILSAVVTLIEHAPEVAGAIVSAIIAVIRALPTLIAEVISAMLGWIDDITGLNLGGWANTLLGFFGGGNILGSFMNSILGIGHNVSSTVSHVSSGQIGSNPISMLIDSLFGGNAFEPTNGWVPDTALGGIGATGALVTVTAGSQSLLSNGIAVYPGQTITAGATTSAASLGASGSVSSDPVSVNLNLYAAGQGLPGQGAPGALLASVPLASYGYSPNPGLITEWTDEVLSDSYTVPATISGQIPVEAAVMLAISDEIDSGEVLFHTPLFEKPDLLPQAVVDNLPEDKQAILDNTAGTSNAIPSDIADRFAGIATGTGLIDWDYTPDVRTTVDNITNSLRGWDGSDFDHADAVDALTATRTGSVGHAQSITTLQQQILLLNELVAALEPPAPSKKYMADYFSAAHAHDLGSDWSLTYSGAGAGEIYSDAIHAHWRDYAGPRYCLAKWDGTDTDTLTDYQYIAQVFAGAPYYYPDAWGYNDLLARISSDLQNYLRFRLYDNHYWELACVVSNTPTVLANGDLGRVPSSTMAFACGDLASTTVRKHSVYVDSQLVWSGTETTSQYGASYRGLGNGYGIGSSFAALAAPIDTWAGSDQ